MPLIRSDSKGFGIQAAFAAAFLFFSLRNGLLDLPDVLRSYDRLVLWLLIGTILYAGLFVGGHHLLRWKGVGSRGAYAALGAAALVMLQAVMQGPQDLAAAFTRGVGLMQFIFPALLGAAFGFLYAKRAGWEEAPDDWSRLDGAGAPSSASDGAVQAGGSTYFAGPVRVRTSIPIILLAALGGMLLCGLARMAFYTSWEMSLLGDASTADALRHAAGASAFGGFMMVAEAVIGVPILFVSILAGHYVARGFGRSDYGAYFGIGLVAPIILVVVGMFVLAPLALALALANGVAMVLYRNLAGLEPVPVREDIIVAREQDLVPANHPRRAFGRVVRSR
ncbi:hypothetical protein [Brevundimonas lutea]|uniref:hypothetical protein n=1 Tax=Brevundimonas lutea TaxID=2293980 RepID=UPI0013CEBABE|nr:hypothetical protein [Brevundimonas lutea]